jgi:hypothetical protein
MASRKLSYFEPGPTLAWKCRPTTSPMAPQTSAVTARRIRSLSLIPRVRNDIAPL